jgi:hypothetical protein
MQYARSASVVLILFLVFVFMDDSFGIHRRVQQLLVKMGKPLEEGQRIFCHRNFVFGQADSPLPPRNVSADCGFRASCHVNAIFRWGSIC